MDDQARGGLVKAELTSSKNRLPRFISWFIDPVGGAHTDWEKARSGHDAEYGVSILIKPKTISSKEGRILQVLRFGICIIYKGGLGAVKAPVPFDYFSCVSLGYGQLVQGLAK